MGHDADIQGLGVSFAPDSGERAEAASAPHSLIGSVGTGVVRESSLIEESWISDRDEQRCDHYLEHRLLAQEYEGLRMGRELHDSTSQLLLSLRLSIARLQSSREAGEPDEILTEINETARQIEQEIRAFSYLHYPAELGRGGLVPALHSLAKGFGARANLQISFSCTCDDTIADEAVATALLRVAQEALMNVHRHAHARSVRMKLVKRNDQVTFSVEDDGRGLPARDDPALTKGVGLRGMRHRIERLGGRFSIRRLKHGTKVVANLALGRWKPARLPKPDGGKADYPYHAQ